MCSVQARTKSLHKHDKYITRPLHKSLWDQFGSSSDGSASSPRQMREMHSAFSLIKGFRMDVLELKAMEPNFYFIAVGRTWKMALGENDGCRNQYKAWLEY